MTDLEKQICDAEAELRKAKEKLVSLHQSQPGEEVKNYDFTGANGKTTLDELFADKDELIVIHNMGTGCAYCTLWADGFNGFTKPLQDRAAFAVTTADEYKSFAAFADKRGWKFPIYSTDGEKSFQRDMGFLGKDPQGTGEIVWPGMSLFYKEDGKIFRKTRAGFGPGDEFCSIWHMFDLLKNGVDNWQPKFDY